MFLGLPRAATHARRPATTECAATYRVATRFHYFAIGDRSIVGWLRAVGPRPIISLYCRLPGADIAPASKITAVPLRFKDYARPEAFPRYARGRRQSFHQPLPHATYFEVSLLPCASQSAAPRRREASAARFDSFTVSLSHHRQGPSAPPSAPPRAAPRPPSGSLD